MIVDANIWIARYITTDAYHAQSTQWLNHQASAGTGLVGPQFVLPEVAGAVARITGSSLRGQEALNHLLAIPRLRLVPVDRTLFLEAASLAARLRLRGADSVYVAVARRLGLPLVTWDQQVAQRAGVVITVIAPAAT